MNENNIIKGMESFIKKQEEFEAKRQLTIHPIRQKYLEEVMEYEKLSNNEKLVFGSYPFLPKELGCMTNDYIFAMSLKHLFSEIQEIEK